MMGYIDLHLPISVPVTFQCRQSITNVCTLFLSPQVIESSVIVLNGDPHSRMSQTNNAYHLLLLIGSHFLGKAVTELRGCKLTITRHQAVMEILIKTTHKYN